MIEHTLTRASTKEHGEQVLQQADIPAVELSPGAHARPFVTPSSTVSFVNLSAYSELTRHIQEHDEVVVILHGARDDALAGKLYRLEQGDVLFVPAGIEHGSITYGAGCLAIEFSTPGRQDLIQKLESVLNRGA